MTRTELETLRDLLKIALNQTGCFTKTECNMFSHSVEAVESALHYPDGDNDAGTWSHKCPNHK